MRIRAAIRRDLDELEDVEDDAGGLFSANGFDFSAVAPTSRQARYWDAFDEGIIFVADVPTVGVAGFIAIEPLDGEAHILELSVRRSSQRRGVGRQLLVRAETWAREQGFPALTLTTFRDVPWNGPFYAGLGFAEVAVSDERPGLNDERSQETARGLDTVAARIAMRKALA